MFSFKKTPPQLDSDATATTIHSARLNELEAYMAAFDQSNAIIEFDPEGNILTANENFLAAMGYTLQEIQGRHHRVFASIRTFHFG
jgi:methyl-accepting chemotaxis protein